MKNRMMSKDNAVLPVEAARTLGISLEYCYRLIWVGRLSAEKINGRWRVCAESVNQRLKMQQELAALRLGRAAPNEGESECPQRKLKSQ